MQRRGWLRNVDLVQASGTKPNGRPVIDQSRVSVWRRGVARPSYTHAKLVGEIFQDEDGALRAAGYLPLEPDVRMEADSDGEWAITIEIPPGTPDEVIQLAVSVAKATIKQRLGQLLSGTPPIEDE